MEGEGRCRMIVRTHCRLLPFSRLSTLVLLASVSILAKDATTYYVSTTGSDGNPGMLGRGGRPPDGGIGGGGTVMPPEPEPVIEIASAAAGAARASAAPERSAAARVY